MLEDHITKNRHNGASETMRVLIFSLIYIEKKFHKKMSGCLIIKKWL